MFTKPSKGTVKGVVVSNFKANENPANVQKGQSLHNTTSSDSYGQINDSIDALPLVRDSGSPSRCIAEVVERKAMTTACSMRLVNTVSLPAPCVMEVKPSEAELQQARRVFVGSFAAVNWHKYEHKFLEYAFQDEVKSDHRWIFCTQGSLLTGMCTIASCGNYSLYIAQLAVAVGFRRAGIGKAMMEYIFGKNLAVKQIHTIVRHANTPAKLFYKNLGFIPSSYMHKGYSATDYEGLTWTRPKVKANR